MRLDLSAADTDVIFDRYWNPHLIMTISPLCAKRRYYKPTSSIFLIVLRFSCVLRVLKILIVSRLSSVSSGFLVSFISCVSRILGVLTVWRVLRVWRVLSVLSALIINLRRLVAFLPFKKKKKNRTACRHTFLIWLSVWINTYPQGMHI